MKVTSSKLWIGPDYAVALAAVRAGVGYGSRVVVLAGPGNNGGDGYVAARYLKTRGANVEVQAFSPPRTREAIDAAAKARSVGVRIADFGAPGDEDVVIDALFGGGGTRRTSTLHHDMDGHRQPDSFGGLPNRSRSEHRECRKHCISSCRDHHLRHLENRSCTRSGAPNFCGRVTPVDIGINGGEPSMFIAEPTRRPSTPKRA